MARHWQYATESVGRVMKTKHVSRLFRRFPRANEAASALEYALVIGVVATAIAAALIAFSGSIPAALQTMGDEATEAATAAGD